MDQHQANQSDQSAWLAEQFEANRDHLRAVAYRMLGSASEADDAVQEGWLRLSRADTSGVANLRAWLTTVVARICLDTLRARTARREESLDAHTPERIPSAANAAGGNPEYEAIMADSVGLALLVVLETLTPAERLAFVLHDLFDVPFDDIAPIVRRTPAATRQLASRARRRVRGAAEAADAGDDADLTHQRAIVDAFLVAAQSGDLNALLALLAPDAVYRADAAGVAVGGEPEAHGARAVAGQFLGRARAARLALVGGTVGLMWAPGGVPRVAFAFTIAQGQITTIEMIADPARLAQLAPRILEA